MSDPFLFDGPTLWSFSGGRTSAYMLWRALQSYGGKLPDDHVVVFANTGKEREEALRFVYECGTRWGVPIVWLERREGGLVEQVGFNSASRNGEPFAQLISEKKYLPNAVARFCTVELKVLTIKRWLTSLLTIPLIGWSEWTNVVGLRRDEGKRVMRAWAREGSSDWKEPYRSAFPLYEAGVGRHTVDEFWSEQDFDLEILSADGNCDKCFLKSLKRQMWSERQHPGESDWWAGQEAATGGRFVTEYSYAEIQQRVRDQPLLPGLTDDDERDAECGLWCPGNAA